MARTISSSSVMPTSPAIFILDLRNRFVCETHRSQSRRGSNGSTRPYRGAAVGCRTADPPAASTGERPTMIRRDSRPCFFSLQLWPWHGAYGHADCPAAIDQAVAKRSGGRSCGSGAALLLRRLAELLEQRIRGGGPDRTVA